MEKNKSKKRKMFISVLPGEQVEVVLTADGKVEEYYIEMLHQAKTRGNIYKGTIHNVDSSLQAAFINYGKEKNGFLQVDEVHPEYYRVKHDSSKYKYPLLQKVLKSGQEMLVQVVKEPVGTKGGFLTTYLSIPGRFVVLTPGRSQIGVSRKVEDEKERARLKKIVEGLAPGEDLGVIVRTASVGQSKTSLSKDLQFLKRLWKEVRKTGASSSPPALIYQEPDLASRAVRDYLTSDVGEIWLDHKETADQVSNVVSLIFPRQRNIVKLHADEDKTLWDRFNLRKQLEGIYSRRVGLPSGGELVFDQTEALMSIDINSGRIGGKTNFHEMAFKTNMEAAEAIPQQLRLRDIGGQIVIDFIEMKDRNQWREVEKVMRNGMKNDRARHDVGRMSKFGLLQVVRQRLGSSALPVSTEPCPCCGGSGTRRNMEWQALNAIKDMAKQLRQANGQDVVEIRLEEELAFYILNHKRSKLLEMEQSFDKAIRVKPKQM